jgi:hypothetical protein
MRRTLGVMAGVLGGLLLSGPAWADVTLTSKSTGKMAGGDGTTQVIKIKGGKMRTDMTRGDDQTSVIFDVEAGKMITLDHKKKEAIVMDTAAMTETMSKVNEADVKASLTPTSEKKQVAGYDCTVHDSDVRVGFSPAEGMNLQIQMTGPVCVSASAPGKAEYTEFYTAAVKKGFFFTDPRAAKAQPGPAKAFAELYKKWAEAGVPLSSNITLKFEGGGFMTGMMNKMIGGPTTNEVTKVDTAAIADTEFAAPAGYKVKTP